jgi:hypothetical protein
VRRSGNRAILSLAFAALAGPVGCDCKGSEPDDQTDDVAISPSPNLKFKGPARIAADLSQALEIDRDQVCAELGRFGCEEVHEVALGGVEPYRLGLYTPLDRATATTPMAVERMAMSACVQRVDADLGGASPVIFGGLEIDDGGCLADPEAGVVAVAIKTLYERALLRPATESETEHLRDLYRDVEPGSAQPARDWAVLSCFAVFTSVEQLFY